MKPVNESYNNKVNRLCKRHMAKMLDRFRQQNVLTTDMEKSIVKAFGYLMDDLKSSNTKEQSNENQKLG